MPSFQIEMRGVRELEVKLLGLERKIGKRVVRQAVRVGAKMILAATKAKAPVRKAEVERTVVKGKGAKARESAKKMRGYMRASLVIRAGKRDKPGTYAVAQRFDTQRFPQLVTYHNGRRYFYPAAVEYGHAASGAFAAGPDVPPHSFTKPAFEATKHAAGQAIINELKTGIEREAAK